MSDSNVGVETGAVESCAVKSDLVTNLIKEGVVHAQSAQESYRSAALAFVASLINPMGLTSSDYTEVVSTAKRLYRDDFSGDHNAVSFFGDVVLTSLAASMPISFEKTVTEKGEKVKKEVHTNGTDASNMSKHDVRAAAKAVREEIGTARAEGGGRAPQTPTSSPAQSVFSLVELKKQLAGLFDNSQGAVQVMRDNLSQYGVEVMLTTELQGLREELAAVKTDKTALVKEVRALKKAAK